MSNILYIGPYREFSGMGNAARKYIQALNRAGHSVSIRPIYNIFKLYPESEIPKEILELENNRKVSYDICIQHCYPHQFHYTNKTNKTIGIVHLESKNYQKNVFQYLSLMDELIVGSASCRDSIIRCGVNKPIHIIPEPIDLDEIDSFKQIATKENKEFTFYTIGDFCSRKNILTLMLAYSILSSRYKNINLIIKTKNSISESYIKNSIDINNTIFPAMLQDNKKQPRIIVGETEYKNILLLHKKGDCYVDISSGESFGYAALEAMCFDNHIIATEGIGTSDLIEDFGLGVSSEESFCLEENKTYFMYNTVFQTWMKPNLHDLVKKMELAILETPQERTIRIKKQREKLEKCSINSVSKILRDL